MPLGSPSFATKCEHKLKRRKKLWPSFRGSSPVYQPWKSVPSLVVSMRNQDCMSRERKDTNTCSRVALVHTASSRNTFAILHLDLTSLVMKSRIIFPMSRHMGLRAHHQLRKTRRTGPSRPLVCKSSETPLTRTSSKALLRASIFMLF